MPRSSPEWRAGAAAPRTDAMSQPQPKPEIGGHVALLVVQFCFGLFPLFGKIANEGFTPHAVWAWRILFGSASLMLIAAIAQRGKIAIALKDVPLLIVCALTGVAVNQLLFLEGLEHARTSDAGLVMCTIPVFTLVIAAAVRQEKLTWRKSLGIAVAFSGTAWLLALRGDTDGAPQVRGIILMMLNALSYSVYLIISRPLTRRYPPMVLIAWVFVLSLWTVPIFARDAVLLPEGASEKAWNSLAYILLFPTTIAYLLNLFALSRVTASTTTVYIYLQPVIAGFAGVLVLKETLEPATLIAAAFIFSGLWLAVGRIPRRRRKSVEACATSS